MSSVAEVMLGAAGLDDSIEGLFPKDPNDPNSRILRLIHFTRLHCVTTEDNTGADECQLDIWADEIAGQTAGQANELKELLGIVGGALTTTISLPHIGSPIRVTKNLNDGESTDFHHTLPLIRRVGVSLTDLDAGSWPDEHDHLGSHGISSHGGGINADVEGKGYVVFDLDDAEYRLYYTVEDVRLQETSSTDTSDDPPDDDLVEINLSKLFGDDDKSESEGGISLPNLGMKIGSLRTSKAPQEKEAQPIRVPARRGAAAPTA